MRELAVAATQEAWVEWIREDLAPIRVRMAGEGEEMEAAGRAGALLLDAARGRAREVLANSRVPVVAICQEDQAEGLLEQGAWDVAVRPLRRALLKHALERLLRQARSRRDIARLKRVNRRRRHQIREMWQAGEVVRQITGSLYIEDILKSILYGLRRHVDLDRVVLGLINGRKKVEEVKVALGVDRGQLGEAAWAVEDSSPVWAALARKGAPLIVDAEREKGLPPFVKEAFGKRFVKVPMIVRRQILGTIMCGRAGGAVAARDLRLLKVFSQYAAIAIQNARLYYDVLKSEEELRRTHEKLVEAEKMALAGQMAVSINHEINNPLCNISLIGQTLAGKAQGESGETARLLGELNSNVKRIKEVTRKLREMRQAPLTEYLPDQMMVDLTMKEDRQ